MASDYVPERSRNADSVLSAGLTITNTDTGATAQAVVADACPGCSERSYGALDLSTGLFSALGNLDQGIRKHILLSLIMFL